MLITRAPLRISLGGGGTDLEAYYERFGGLVVSTSIDKYFYTLISPAESTSLQIISADYRTLVQRSSGGELDGGGELVLPEAILRHFAVNGGLHMFLASEVPPGTGLGSSSAAAVGIIHALAIWLKRPLKTSQLAELAALIEISRLGLPIGKQDHYASAFGGLNLLTFCRDGVEVVPLLIDPAVKHTLEKRLMLFSTGRSRESTSVLTQQQKSTREQNPAVLRSLHAIKQAAWEIKACLERGDLDEFARLLDFSWQEKRRLAPGLSNQFIDEIYALACQCGAKAGKITGAGGGGFLLLYCPEEAQVAATAALKKRGLKRMFFHFEQEGASIVLNHAPEKELSPACSGEAMEVSPAHASSIYL